LLELLHDRVRYTGVLFGVGKLVPNPPSVTLERRFGDCKDKAVVFTSMLRAAGVPAQLALVNSGIAPDVSAELPGMGGFNHMIVRVPGERPLYIDPTAEHMKVGELPTEIQGRHVLVIAGDGTALQRTPDPQPADQRRHIVKELRLPDYGRADLAISVRENGAEAARNRPALAGHGEVATGQREDILKAAYGATSIAGFEQADDPASGDLTYRFEARGVSTASTDFDEAVVRERFDGLFNRIPVYLRMSDAARGPFFNGDDGADEPAPRTADWIFEPFVTELKLQITLPRGFHSRGLPDDRELRFGPASLSQRFGIDEMGRVYATIRADSGSGRYTAEEGDAFRRSFLENGSALSLELRFEHEAIALLQAGDEPGALRRHRELIAEEPGKSIHRIRAARRFMAFGLVDEAREQARLAIEMEPRSALAHSTHGLMLEYNEHGVRFGRGFDREGAIKAHRESTVLDEEKRWYHGNLAVVAERGVDGSRYGPGADLELAIDSYRKYVADDPGWAAGADLLIGSLWHANRYNEIATIAVDPASEGPALPYQLAARVMTAGVQPALREDSARGDLAVRRRRIERAIQLLFAARHYEQAQQLMATIGQEGRGGGEMEPVFVQLMPNTRRVEQLPAPPATASGAAESVMRIAFEPGTTIKDFAPWISRHVGRRDDMEPLARQLQDAARRLRHPLTLLVGDDGALVRDVVVGNLEYRESAAPGDARRVTVLMRDIAVVTLLMVRDGDHWRLLTMSPQWYLVGREALVRLDAGDLPAARAWIEFVREDTERNAFYDESPWFGQLAAVLPRESADEESALRLAAHLLLAGPVTVAGTIKDFRQLEPLATTAERRMAWHWMIYRAAGEAGDYEQQVSMARVMHAEDSTAADAYLRLSTAQGQAGHWQEAESTAREWLAKHRSDGRAPRALAQALNALGRAEEGLALLAPRVQAGRADAVQLNSYAWQALIADAVDEGAITAAENAFNLWSQRDYATGHTLACLYAAAGRITEARDLMQSLFDEIPSADPDDASAWLLRGLIFEQLGEAAAASRAYRKVGVSVPFDPNSPQAIASARLAKLVHR
jgi:tetratricopeptide (TPR) repeat protein